MTEKVGQNHRFHFFSFFIMTCFSKFYLVVKITLISSNENNLVYCKQEIINLAQSISIKSQAINKYDMLDWSQTTIHKYYEYCLKQRVIPTLDLDNITLELVGEKLAVMTFLR